jgi:hypothetical protein
MGGELLDTTANSSRLLNGLADSAQVNAMKRNPNSRLRYLLTLVLVPATLAFTAPPARACTIFVLTDANHALFCNNEDWSNPKSRIWFVPAGKGHYGAAYVGFDEGGPFGGLNTEGLAYDWVMVSKTPQKWESALPPARGCTAQRMLETCATAKDAIAFYQAYAEPGFATSVILVADKSGASVIIGMKDGRMVFEESRQSRGFGFGQRFLQAALDRRAALPKQPEPTAAEGFKILYDGRQAGEYSTKYSNIFDLKSGDIYLRPFSEGEGETMFNLAGELKKGSHYYEISTIRQQLTASLRPLPPNMERLPLEAYKPILDREPKVTTHVGELLRDVARGTPHAEDYTADYWKSEVLPNLARVQADLKRCGELRSVTLVGRNEINGLRSYRYRVEFANATMLIRVGLDAQNKMAASYGEDLEWKLAAKPPKPQRP